MIKQQILNVIDEYTDKIVEDNSTNYGNKDTLTGHTWKSWSTNVINHTNCQYINYYERFCELFDLMTELEIRRYVKHLSQQGCIYTDIFGCFTSFQKIHNVKITTRSIKKMSKETLVKLLSYTIMVECIYNYYLDRMEKLFGW
jgi:hypothetical protein